MCEKLSVLLRNFIDATYCLRLVKISFLFLVYSFHKTPGTEVAIKSVNEADF